MKIADMMAEIRRDHPDAECVSGFGPWQVYSKPGVGRTLLGAAPDRYRAVELALQAVRKSRPKEKPMTVAEAKAAVKLRIPKATWGYNHNGVYIWNGISGYDPIGGYAKTEGQAWKAAAAAIRASENEEKS